ncbi:MAG TPA: hypothetical protein VFB45_16180 [Pseudolabrys sp.]|nr:hypothetical protein [Pseudolabrys sp.]
MKKGLIALAAAATLAAATFAAPQPADARCFGCAVGAGIVGGAILGAAIANSQPRYYAPAPGYVAYPGYAVAAPYGCPGGYWARRPLYDRFGNVVGYSRPRFFCP